MSVHPTVGDIYRCAGRPGKHEILLALHIVRIDLHLQFEAGMHRPDLLRKAHIGAAGELERPRAVRFLYKIRRTLLPVQRLDVQRKHRTVAVAGLTLTETGDERHIAAEDAPEVASSRTRYNGTARGRELVSDVKEARSVGGNLGDLFGVAFKHMELHPPARSFAENERLGTPDPVFLVDGLEAQNGIRQTRLQAEREIGRLHHLRIRYAFLRKVARKDKVGTLLSRQTDNFVALKIGDRDLPLEVVLHIRFKDGGRRLRTRDFDQQIVRPVVRHRAGEHEARPFDCDVSASAEHRQLCVRSAVKFDFTEQMPALAVDCISLEGNADANGIEVAHTLSVVHVNGIGLVNDGNRPETRIALHASANLTNAICIGLADVQRPRRTLGQIAQRMLRPLVLNAARRTKTHRPQAVGIVGTHSLRPNRKLRNEHRIIYQPRNILLEPCRRQSAALQFLRREAAHDLAVGRLPCKRHGDVGIIKRSVGNIEHFDFKRLARHQLLAVGNDEIRNRCIVAGEHIGLKTVCDIVIVAHYALIGETMRDHRTETRVLVLFIPLAADHEIGIELNERGKHIAKHARAGAVEPVVPTVGVFVSGRRPAPKALLLEFGLGKHRMHQRNKHRIEKPRIVAAVPRRFATVVTQSIENLERAFKALAHFPEHVGTVAVGRIPSALQPEHVVRHDKELVAETRRQFLFQLSVERKVLLADGGIAGEHHLSVDAEGVRRVQRLLGAINAILQRKTGGKFHKNLGLRPGLQRRRQHFLAVFGEGEHGKAGLLAQAPHLNRLLPSFFIEPRPFFHILIHISQARILQKRTVVPMVQKIPAVDAVLKLRADKEIRPPRLAYIRNLRPFSEQFFRIGRKLPVRGAKTVFVRRRIFSSGSGLLNLFRSGCHRLFVGAFLTARGEGRYDSCD